MGCLEGLLGSEWVSVAGITISFGLGDLSCLGSE